MAWEALAQTQRGLAPVAKPESWAMLAGLGLTHWVAMRRRRASLKPVAKQA